MELIEIQIVPVIVFLRLFLQKLFQILDGVIFEKI